MNIPANSKISNFTDLTTWQEAHRLALLIYGITCNLPDREKYNIVNQLERAVVSITNNIAEGFGRHSNKEEVQFLYVSLGSLKEVQNMSIICKDLGYISDDQFLEINDQTSSVSRLLRGLIRSCQVN